MLNKTEYESLNNHSRELSAGTQTKYHKWIQENLLLVSATAISLSVLLILSIFIALSGKRPLPENGFSKTEDNQNNSLSSNAPSNDRNSTPELYSVPNQPAKSQAADRDLSTQNIPVESHVNLIPKPYIDLVFAPHPSVFGSNPQKENGYIFGWRPPRCTDEQIFQRAGLQYKSLSTQLLVDGVAKHLINHADENTNEVVLIHCPRYPRDLEVAILDSSGTRWASSGKILLQKISGKKCIPISLKRFATHGLSDPFNRIDGKYFQ